MMSLPKLQHDGIEVRHDSYPTASGRVHHDEPSPTKWRQQRHHDPLPLGCGMFIYPSASVKVEGWRHHDEPSHNYKMAARSAIMI